MSKKETKTSKKVVNIVITVVLVLVLLLVGALVYSRAANKPLFLFGKSAVWIVSPSMEPTIETNSFILVEKADASTVNVGDYVMFKSDDPVLRGGYCTHELIERNPDGTFVSKGINDRTNPAPDDDPVRPESIVGKYVKNLPVLTALMRFFSQGIGLALFILIMIGLCAAAFVPDIVKSVKASKAKDGSLSEEEKRKLIEEEIEKIKGSKEDKQ